jgi:hypothetical protein
MNGQRHFADWELALYRLGELPPRRKRALETQLAQDPILAERLASLEAREAALMERLPPRVVAARAEEAARSEPKRRLGWRLAAPALIAAAALLVAIPTLGPDTGETPAQQRSPGVRDKGVTPYLRVHREVPGGLEELKPGDRLGAGERLQISYAGLGRGYGVVLSVDGRGAVTLHLPRDGAQAAELALEGTVDLAESYELDDAPTYERFFLVTAREPFELAPVLSAAEALDDERATLELPRALEQVEFVIRKEPSP